MNKLSAGWRPPNFAADEDKTMVARLLTPILLTLFVVPLILVIPIVALKLEIAQRFLMLTTFTAGLSLVLFWLMRRGRVLAASLGLVVGLWLGMTVTSWTGGGIWSPAFVGYLIIILLAGLLLGERWGIGITILCGTSGWGMVYADSAGWLPAAATPSALSRLLIYAVFFAMAVLLQTFASRTAREALNRARQEVTERRRAEQSLRESDQQLRASLHEKEILLKEVHHRVKNNMQVIVSMMNLQSAYISDPQLLDIFTDSQNRVRSMALVHEQLYKSANLAQIDFRDYLQHLASTLFHSYSPRVSHLDLTFDIGEIALSVEAAIPCGLMVNELISNSLKHAFPNRASGFIRVTLRESAPRILTLSVEDNGRGLPPDFDLTQTESLGMQLIVSLVKQLSGEFEIIRLEAGTRFTVRFTPPP